MKRIILSLFSCLLLVVPVFAEELTEELTPGQIGFLTREPWYEDEMGYGWVTYPDSPLNDDLPYDYVYVETENDPLPEGFIHCQGGDGLIGLFSMNWRPDPIIPNEDLPNYTTKELLDIFLEESAMKHLEMSSIRIQGSAAGMRIKLAIEGLQWEYNVFNEILQRQDLTEVLFDIYHFGCNADAVELFMIADQLEYGEYPFLRKLELEIKKDTIKLIEFVHYFMGDIEHFRLYQGIYNSYVITTGQLDCGKFFRVVFLILKNTTLCILWGYLLKELSKYLNQNPLTAAYRT